MAFPETMEINYMHSFWRIFKYVKPQWPRVIVVVTAAFLVAFLFSLSFMTVIPLLKVMMGEEGLHGWIDRKVCNWRYEVDFYVPELTDFMDANDPDIANYLLVTNVKDKSIAQTAGLTREDRIVGIGNKIKDQTPRSKLLEELATTPQQSQITLHLTRPNNLGGQVPHQLELKTSKNPFYVNYAMSLSKYLTGFIPRGQSTSYKLKAVIFIIILMGVVTFIRCISTFYQKYLAAKIMHVSIAKLREDAFAHVMTMPMGFFSVKGTNDTISRLLGDIPAIGIGIKIMLGKALREPLKAIFCVGGAMLISFKLTLIFLCCAPPTVALGVLLGKKIKKHTKKWLISSALMLGRLEGAINALGVVKVYNRQETENQAYHQVNRRFLKQALHIAKVDASTGPIMEVLGMIAGSAALLVGAHWVTNADMKPSSFFTLLIMLGVAAESARKSSDIWNKIQGANAAAERVFSLTGQSKELEKPGSIELPVLKREIEFRNVVFTYPGCDRPVLKGINLSVKAGHNIAVVGPNGSGKTTLVNLIPRFYNTDNGAILIDGQDIGNVTLRSLRNQIGMVTQNVVTFNDSIAANIGYGKHEATLKEIIDAANRSFAHEFIEPLPDGYETIIGEHGAGLSGGQLQRIVIARAILKNPPILIFDEATSQVDADSEAKIHKALAELMHNRTCFIIAHRFSTVINADVIVVMDDGQIVARGQHEELIEKCTLYQSLYETQLIKTQ